jgi:AraC-like DNA-binding protein
MRTERARLLHAIQSVLNRDPWPRRVRLCGRCVPPPSLSYVVSFPRLEIPLAGDYRNEMDVAGEARVVSVRPGVAVFAPPHCWNRPTWQKRTKVLCVLFGQKHIGFSLVTSTGASAPVSAEKLAIAHAKGSAMFRITEALSDLNNGQPPPEALSGLVRSLTYLVRQALQNPPVEGKGNAAQRFELIAGYLQSHYQQDITRDRVADQFGVSPNHLSRLFRSSGHVGFNEYLTHVRTDRAKFLLRTYRMRLDDVARQCGFSDTTYFCRVFRRVTKCTPGDYRRQNAMPQE